MTQPPAAPPAQLSLAEFIPLMGLLTALDALSIDAMLPALSQIGQDLHVASANDVQLIVGFMFVGVTLGQAVGGPLSDSVGRKPAIYWGLGVYLIGCILAIFSQTFQLMLVARTLQGFGASIPMVVTIALVRDLYRGAPMARIMSFMGSVFITVPILAPLAGQGILLVAHWRFIFVMFAVLAFPAAIWLALRQPETLSPADRRPFALRMLWSAFLEVCRTRRAIGYATASGLLLGAFLGYLASTQQIFQDTYQVGRYFVLFFSSLSAAIGLALFSNGKLVIRFGMRRMADFGFVWIAILSVVFLPVVFAYSGKPPLWLWMAYLWPCFFGVGLLFGNLNALAMEPLGHIAGMGSAVSSTVTMLIGLPLGTAIARAYDGTVLPVVAGFAVLASLALLVMRWAAMGWNEQVEQSLATSNRSS